MTTFVDKEVVIDIVHHVYDDDDDDLQQVLAIVGLLVGQLLDDTPT